MKLIKPYYTMKQMLQSVLFSLLVMCIAVSCNDINFNGSQSGKAKMDVHLTDAPGDYEEVNIEVQGLRIHFTPAGMDTVEMNPEKDGEWIDLPVDPMTVNLLDLQNGVDTLLSSAELDPGYYRELRLMLGGNNTVVVDGSTNDLKVPSGQQSGYKIKFETELEAGEDIDVVVDFDASRSVHKAGNSGKYILKPVLKAFVETGDDVETGSIIGVVEPLEADAMVYAIVGDDTTASAQPDEDNGGFMMQGLESGLYDVSIDAMNEQYSDSTLADVSVLAGEETDVGTIVLDEN